MATVAEAWRAATERHVLEEAASQGERVVRALDAAEAVCQASWADTADVVPGLEDSYESARRAIRDATGEVHRAAVRLRHVAGG